jgi:hypothetical protein
MVVLRAPRTSTRAALSSSVLVLAGDHVMLAVSIVQQRQSAMAWFLQARTLGLGSAKRVTATQ